MTHGCAVAILALTTAGCHLVEGYRSLSADAAAPSVDAAVADAATESETAPDAGPDLSVLADGEPDLSQQIDVGFGLDSQGDAESSADSGVALSSGLVAHWSFDEGGGTVALDSSGNGHDAALMHMEAENWIPGVGGTALMISSDDYVMFSCDGCPGFPYAVSLWFRPTVLAGALFAYGVGGWGGGVQKTIAMTGSYLHAGTISLRRGIALSELSVNTWHHLVANYPDARTIEVYLDGVNKTVETNNYWNAKLCTMGRRLPPYSALQYEGALDEVRLYSRVLTPAEIRALSEGTD